MIRKNYEKTLERRSETHIPSHAQRNPRAEYHELVAELEIVNRYGVHSRPAAGFVKIASQYDSDVIVEKDGNRVSGKGIMGLMTLELSKGTKFKIYVNGNGDAHACLNELKEFIASGCDNDDEASALK